MPDAPVHLSVVLATFNRAKLLKGALEALGGQRVPGHVRWEIVVVDNNSTDDTKAVATEFAARTHVPVQYVFEGRQGHSRARNAGVAAAHGDILAFTDDDVLPHPDWVARAVETMEAWKADGAGGRVLPHWEVPPPRWVSRSPRFRGILALMEYPEREVLRDGTGQGAQIRGANMMFRKILFDRLGLFETSLGRLGNKLGTTEDDDFVWRAVKAGHTLVYDPRLAVDHRIGPDRLRRSYFLRWTFDTAEIDIAHEPPPSPPLWLGVPRWQYFRRSRERP